ncbi:MAG: hypothetical protein KF696_00135 [Planctomycetes bacterium]|nr:hypothetical protein [Planctomycetota bacterium]MCW8134654.1 hypothetical protein [Planctomycetota bacterium]
MKTYLHVALTAALLYFGASLHAEESEPNDSPEQANSLDSPQGTLAGTLSTADVDCYTLAVNGPTVLAVRVLSASPIGFSVGLGADIEDLRVPRHRVYSETTAYLEFLVFVPEEAAVLAVRIDRGVTDQLSEYPGFESAIEYTLVYRIGAGSGSAPGLSVENSPFEVKECQPLTFEAVGTPNSSGVIRYRMVATVWEPVGAVLDPVSGEFSWLPGYTDAGERQIVVVATEYPSNLPAGEVGWSAFLVIGISVANVNRPPEISERPSINVEYGAFVVTEFCILDPDGDDVNVSVSLNGSPLPSSATWKHGRFTWRPASDDLGDNTLLITAAELENPESASQFSLLIVVIEPDSGNIDPVVWRPRVVWNGDSANPSWMFAAIFEDADVDGAAQWWQVQIAVDNGFGTSDIVWDSGQLSGGGTPVTFGDTMHCFYSSVLAWNTVHHWRIRACDNDNGVGAWVVGPGFKTPPEPPAPVVTLSEVVDTVVQSDPEELPYANSEVEVTAERAFTVAFHLSEGERVHLRMSRDGDEALFIELWQIVTETTGIVRIAHAWSVEDSGDLERCLQYTARADALHVLCIHYYDTESTNSTNLDIYINVAPRPPISPNENRVGDLGDQAPYGLDHTAPKPDPEWGSGPLWREPVAAPQGSNPPASDCRWRVNIQFLDEVNEKSEVFKKLKNGTQEVPDVYINHERVSFQDIQKYHRRALGGYASSFASVTANTVESTSRKNLKYSDGTETSDKVEVKSKRVDGWWVLSATWIGSCGVPKVHVHAFSALTVGITIRAKGGGRKFKDIEQFDVSGAVKRHIFCPQVAVDVDTKLAFALKKEREDGPFQIPSVPTDAADAAIRGANFILQEALDERDDLLYGLTSPEDEGAWDEDAGEATTSNAIAKVKAHAGAHAMVGRSTFFADWGSSWNNNNTANARPRTSEMVIAISLICESSATEACVGDIVRIIYEIGPTPEGEAHLGSQDARIEKNPSNANKSGAITATPKPLQRKNPQGDGPKINETEVEIKGEETQ